jgi:hypothetical protein
VSVTFLRRNRKFSLCGRKENENENEIVFNYCPRNVWTLAFIYIYSVKSKVNVIKFNFDHVLLCWLVAISSRFVDILNVDYSWQWTWTRPRVFERESTVCFAYLLMRLVGLSLTFLFLLLLLLTTGSTSTAATRSFEALLNHFLKIDIILYRNQQISTSSFNFNNWQIFHLRFNSIFLQLFLVHLHLIEFEVTQFFFFDIGSCSTRMKLQENSTWERLLLIV